jgi:hypothetical protein
MLKSFIFQVNFKTIYLIFIYNYNFNYKNMNIMALFRYLLKLLIKLGKKLKKLIQKE